MKNIFLFSASVMLILSSEPLFANSFGNKIGVEENIKLMPKPTAPSMCQAESEIKTRTCSQYGLLGEGTVVEAVTTYTCSGYVYEEVKPLTANGCCVSGLSYEYVVTLPSSFGESNVYVRGCKLPDQRIELPDYEVIPKPIPEVPVVEW